MSNKCPYCGGIGDEFSCTDWTIYKEREYTIKIYEYQCTNCEELFTDEHLKHKTLLQIPQYVEDCNKILDL